MDLSKLDLESFPPIFENTEICSKIQHLDVSNNQLTALHEIIGQLYQLYALNLFNNRITTLPETIGQLRVLANLNLSNNPLTTLPETIEQLTDTIVFGVPELLTIPPVIQGITRLYTWAKKTVSGELKEWARSLSAQHKANLTGWLSRLPNIKNFQPRSPEESKTKLASQIVSFLERATQDPDYLKKLLNVVAATGRTCGDGMAISVIDLHLLDLELTNENLPDLKKVLSYLNNEWLIKVVRKIAVRKIASLPADFNEPLEIRLAYLVHLKERLQLNLPIDSMLFQTYSGTTPQDFDNAFRVIHLLRQGELGNIEKLLPTPQEHARGWAKTFTEEDTFNSFLHHGGESNQPHPIWIAHLKNSPYAEELESVQNIYEEGVEKAENEGDNESFEKVQKEYDTALLKITQKNLAQAGFAKPEHESGGGAK